MVGPRSPAGYPNNACTVTDPTFTPQLCSLDRHRRIRKLITMTNQKKRSLEREINARLYRTMTREGISMDHLDPTQLANWPLLEQQSANKGDYVNLLPPSYRHPFQQPKNTTPAFRKKKRSRVSAQTRAFRHSLAREWAISNEPAPAEAPAKEQPVTSILLITIAGLLMAASLALNSTLLTTLFF